MQGLELQKSIGEQETIGFPLNPGLHSQTVVLLLPMLQIALSPHVTLMHGFVLISQVRPSKCGGQEQEKDLPLDE
jgi:hypothetical protein